MLVSFSSTLPLVLLLIANISRILYTIRFNKRLARTIKSAFISNNTLLIFLSFILLLCILFLHISLSPSNKFLLFQSIWNSNIIIVNFYSSLCAVVTSCHFQTPSFLSSSFRTSLSGAGCTARKRPAIIFHARRVFIHYCPCNTDSTCLPRFYQVSVPEQRIGVYNCADGLFWYAAVCRAGRRTDARENSCMKAFAKRHTPSRSLQKPTPL